MSVVALLQVGDGAVRPVVHDHPDDGQPLFDGGRDCGQLGAHSAIANKGDDGPVRLGDLNTERGSRSETHGGEAARGDEAALGRELVALRHAVLVPPNVGDQDGVGGQRVEQVLQDALRTQWKGITGSQLASPLPQVATDLRYLLAHAGSLTSFGSQGPGGRGERRHGRAHVGNDSDLDRVVAADLVRVDVDLDEAGRRDGPRLVWHPRAGVRFSEPSAQRHDDVGVQGVVVGVFEPPEAWHPEKQRVFVGDHALAHEGMDDWNVKVFGEVDQGGHRFGAAQAPADVEERPLSVCEQPGDSLGRPCVEVGGDGLDWQGKRPCGRVRYDAGEQIHGDV